MEAYFDILIRQKTAAHTLPVQRSAAEYVVRQTAGFRFVFIVLGEYSAKRYIP